MMEDWLKANEGKIAAVLLNDGWHSVREKSFSIVLSARLFVFGDAETPEELETRGPASAILAVRFRKESLDQKVYHP